MTDQQLAFAITCQMLVLGALAGLWRRDRARRLWLLSVHLVGAGLAEAGSMTLPHSVLTWRAWALRELLLLTLALGIVAEVTWRAFAKLPRGGRYARGLLALALLVSWLLVALTPWTDSRLINASWLYVLVAEVLPRLSYGAALVCMALVWSMARRLVPREPLHASVVLGLGCYLFVYSISFGLQGQQAQPTILVYLVTPCTYVALLAHWTWIAWRNEPAVDVPAEVQHRLQPWRA